MEARGVAKGDRIVLVGANSIETLLVFLAATWLGALFSSSSTDMGVSGILQRTVQVSPKVSTPPPFLDVCLTPDSVTCHEMLTSGLILGD
jgi:hypothetical protein